VSKLELLERNVNRTKTCVAGTFRPTTNICYTAG